jgi:preprotein translocase subunit SecA
MIKALITRIIGDRHAREARRMEPLVQQINEIADELQALSESELEGQTEKLRSIVREAIGATEARVAELRDEKRHTEDASERERLTVEIRETEDRLKAELQAALDDVLPAPGRPRHHRDGTDAGLGYGPVRRTAGRRDRTAPRQGRRDGDG